MRYDAIIWDFDGTLFDTYPPMCRDLRDAMAQEGTAFSQEELLEHFTVSRGNVLEFCARRMGGSAGEVDRLYRQWVAEHGQPKAMPFPHAERLLERFARAGGRNFVFTHRSGSVHDYLSGANLTQYFTAVVSSGDTFARKPDPAGNRYLMETYDLTPARTLAVGDRELDILAGKRAGIDACLVSGQPQETAADYQIGSLEQLDAVLELA